MKRSPRAKHSPKRFTNYLQTHETVIEQFKRRGFIITENLSFEALEGSILLEGIIQCLGGIMIDVLKRIVIIEGEGATAIVQRSLYSYNVSLSGKGNIFRYDSPHPDHNRHHHVHRYDVLTNDMEGTIEFIQDEDTTPTLREVIDEAERWFYEHFGTVSQ